MANLKESSFQGIAVQVATREEGETSINFGGSVHDQLGLDIWDLPLAALVLVVKTPTGPTGETQAGLLWCSEYVWDANGAVLHTAGYWND